MALMWACSAFVDEESVRDSPCACPFEDADPIQDWIDMASDTLYYLSDGYFTGTCTRIVRPVTGVADCLPLTVGPWAVCCDDGPKLMLRTPNATVGWVKIDGVTLDPSEYALVDGSWLIRRSGSWPTRNDIRLPDTEVGTWSMEVSWGTLPDLVTSQAAIELVCEFAKGAGVGASEVFPPGVVAANVQGVSVSIEDVAQAVAEGRELLPKVARFLSMYGERGQSAHVFTPENEAYRLVEVAFFQ